MYLNFKMQMNIGPYYNNVTQVTTSVSVHNKGVRLVEFKYYIETLLEPMMI